MAAASPVLPLGLLHVRPFLWWMKVLRIHPTVPATRLIRVSRSCFRALLKWGDPTFLQSRVRMGAIHRRHMITTDASIKGWDAVFEGRPAHGEWTGELLSWHINCLELRAVFLALINFLPVFGKHHVIIRTDNMAVVSHINCQGGSRSRTLDRLVRRLVLWSQDEFLSLRAVHVPGILNLAFKGGYSTTLEPRFCPHRFALWWSHFTLSILLPLLQVRMKGFTCSEDICGPLQRLEKISPVAFVFFCAGCRGLATSKQIFSHFAGLRGAWPSFTSQRSGGFY